MRINLRLLVIFVSAAGVILAGGPRHSEAATFLATSSTFAYDPGEQDFLGDVNFFTGPRDCRPGRRVKVWRVRPGDDRLIKVARSNETGHWVAALGRVAAGRYYATVARKDIAPGAPERICRPFRTITLSAGG